MFWVMQGALIGVTSDDIEFVHPKVEFPTQAQCLETGEASWREWLPHDKRLIYICVPLMPAPSAADSHPAE